MNVTFTRRKTALLRVISAHIGLPRQHFWAAQSRLFFITEKIHSSASHDGETDRLNELGNVWTEYSLKSNPSQMSPQGPVHTEHDAKERDGKYGKVGTALMC